MSAGLRFGLMCAAALIALQTPLRAQGARCAEEAASIRHAMAQLPRLDVAPPDDQQIVCITLETNVLFARRLTAHVAHCPRSPYSRVAEAWQQTGAQYLGLFTDRACKPAVRPFHG